MQVKPSGLEPCGCLRIMYHIELELVECEVGLYSLNEDDFFKVFNFPVA